MTHATPTPVQLATLGTFLARPSRPKDTLSLGELQGFLFAVTSAPERVPMQEMLDFVFGGAGTFATMEEAEAIVGAVAALHHQIKRSAATGVPKLPAGFAFREDPLENFDPASPASQWSRGLRAGHAWLLDSWDVDLPDGMQLELYEDLMILGWFSSRERAEEYQIYRKPDEPSFQVLSKRCVQLFETAMASYAFIGRRIYRARMHIETMVPKRRGAMPRRGDPCPCSSGRAYKNCCGAPVH